MRSRSQAMADAGRAPWRPGEQVAAKCSRDYHLRVGEITADSRPPPGRKIDAQRFDETEVGKAKSCTITEVSPSNRSKPGLRSDLLRTYLQLDSGAGWTASIASYSESIMSPGKLLILGSWRDQSAASSWKPLSFDGAGEIRHREVRVIRDYGMFERREAPQFYPMVERTLQRVSVRWTPSRSRPLIHQLRLALQALADASHLSGGDSGCTVTPQLLRMKAPSCAISASDRRQGKPGHAQIRLERRR